VWGWEHGRATAGEYLKGLRLSDVGTKEREREKKALFWEEAMSEVVIRR